MALLAPRLGAKMQDDMAMSYCELLATAKSAQRRLAVATALA